MAERPYRCICALSWPRGQLWSVGVQGSASFGHLGSVAGRVRGLEVRPSLRMRGSLDLVPGARSAGFEVPREVSATPGFPAPVSNGISSLCGNNSSVACDVIAPPEEERADLKELLNLSCGLRCTPLPTLRRVSRYPFTLLGAWFSFL